jgi:hypothetical protein
MLNLDNAFENKSNNGKLLDYWVNNKITDCSSKVHTKTSRRKKPQVTNQKTNNKKNNIDKDIKKK